MSLDFWLGAVAALCVHWFVTLVIQIRRELHHDQDLEEEDNLW